MRGRHFPLHGSQNDENHKDLEESEPGFLNEIEAITSPEGDGPPAFVEFGATVDQTVRHLASHKCVPVPFLLTASRRCQAGQHVDGVANAEIHHVRS